MSWRLRSIGCSTIPAFATNMALPLRVVRATEFSIETMVDRTLELYREVIANGAGITAAYTFT